VTHFSSSAGRRGKRERIRFLALYHPDERDLIIQIGKSLLFPNRENPSEKYTFSADELICAIHLHKMKEITDSQMVDMLCSAIEFQPPLRRHPQSTELQWTDSGISVFHYVVWKYLANILGPLPPPTLTLTLSTASPQPFLPSCMQFLPDSFPPPGPLASPSLIREDTVDVSTVRDRAAARVRNYYLEPRSTPIETPASYDSSRVHAGDAAADENPLVGRIRKKCRWWVTRGGIFSPHLLGDELPWHVLECTARSMLQQARTPLQQTQSSSAPINDMRSTLVNQMDSVEEYWRGLLSWAGELSSSGVSENPIWPSLPTDSTATKIRRISSELVLSSEHWRFGHPQRQLKPQMSQFEPVALLELGSLCQEVLCYQAIVCRHIAGSCEDFTAHAATVLTQHGLENTSVIRCFAYLDSMNFDIVKAIKAGVILRGERPDLRVAPMQLLNLPPQEMIVLSSKRARLYDPI
jgi:hypothetical protein